MLAGSDLVVNAGGRRILDRVSIGLGSGETIAVVGPNGAGKSTLLRLLSGEIRPAGGSVRLKGRDLSAYNPRQLAQHRAVLSQSITVAFPFTVAEIVAMGAGEQRRRDIERLVADALDDVDLVGFDDRIFPTLSGGEQQRAHFARVLVQMATGEAQHGPGLLLLDEPTASLDLKHQLALAESARRCARRGTAVLAIMHDLNLASVFAERIFVLDGGRLVCEGTPQAVITDTLLTNTFGVSGAVGRVPAATSPFVLPHAAQPAVSPTSTSRFAR